MTGKSTLLICVTSSLISACVPSEYQHWSGPIPLNTIQFESEYVPATGQFIRRNHLEILSIQKIGDQKVIYPPPGEYKTLWLKPGDYRAKIKCDQEPGAPDYAGLRKSGTPLGEDQIYGFTLVVKNAGLGQALECAVDNNGKVFVGLLETIEVIGD